MVGTNAHGQRGPDDDSESDALPATEFRDVPKTSRNLRQLERAGRGSHRTVDPSQSALAANKGYHVICVARILMTRGAPMTTPTRRRCRQYTRAPIVAAAVPSWRRRNRPRVCRRAACMRRPLAAATGPTYAGKRGLDSPLGSEANLEVLNPPAARVCLLSGQCPSGGHRRHRSRTGLSKAARPRSGLAPSSLLPTPSPRANRLDIAR